MEKQFEKASRLKLRFETTKGLISTEDLWSLSIDSLDNLYRGLNKQIKESSEDSLLKTKSTKNSELELKVELIEYIYNVKTDEAAKAKTRSENKAKLAMLEEALADKKNEKLKGMSAEDIEKEIATLQGNI